jgi:hypothetical protein
VPKRLPKYRLPDYPSLSIGLSLGWGTANYPAAPYPVTSENKLNSCNFRVGPRPCSTASKGERNEPCPASRVPTPSNC